MMANFENDEAHAGAQKQKYFCVKKNIGLARLFDGKRKQYQFCFRMTFSLLRRLFFYEKNDIFNTFLISLQLSWMSALSFLRLLSDLSLFQGVPQTSSLPSTSDSRKSPNDSESEVKNALLSQLQKLMTTNLVVRLNNFSMWKVSTSNAKSAPKEFISGKKHANFFCHMNFVTFVLLETIDPIVD